MVVDAAPLLRSVLFFPATRPGLFPKALSSGADAVCVDLEDAVQPSRKEEGRRAALELLAGGAPEEEHVTVLVRINDPSTGVGLHDLTSLVDAGARADGVVVPKLLGPGEVERVEEILLDGLPDAVLVPLVETARGLAAVEEIAVAGRRTVALLFGGVDLSAELGADGGWDSLLYARSRILHAAAVAGIVAVDMPFLDLSDPDGLREEARAAKGLGYAGKIALHPSQVASIQEVFSPSREEVDRARRIVEAYEESGEDVTLLDGRIVELPVVEAARRTLAVAHRMKGEA